MFKKGDSFEWNKSTGETLLLRIIEMYTNREKTVTEFEFSTNNEKQPFYSMDSILLNQKIKDGFIKQIY